MRFVAPLLAVAALACAVPGCDTPPDVHVYVYSSLPAGPSQAAVWRMRDGYLLRPRTLAELDHRPHTLSLWPESATVRVTPLGPLPGHAWLKVAVRLYVPKYRDGCPAELVNYVHLRDREHLRLEVYFADLPSCGSGPGVGSGDAAAVDYQCPLAPGCRVASPAEVASMEALANGPPGDPPLGEGDVDTDETPWTGDPPAGPPAPPSCVAVCDSLPANDDDPDPQHPPATAHTVTDGGAPDAAMDAGTADALDTSAPDAGDIAARTPACNGFDNDCDGVADTGPCPAGQACDRGQCRYRCVEGGCDTAQVCTTATATGDALCVDETCLAVTCPAGQPCRHGTCTDPCAGIACSEGRVCRGGQCFVPCS